MRVVIGEDEVLLREGLRHLLETDGFDVVAAVGTASELEIEVARRRHDGLAVAVGRQRRERHRDELEPGDQHDRGDEDRTQRDPGHRLNVAAERRTPLPSGRGVRAGGA